MEPPIDYTRTADGVVIAYAVSGEGPILISAPGPPDNHLALEWQDPVRRRRIEALGRHRTVVRFDPRGSGLSDRRPGQYSLEERLLDLEAVVGKLGLESFDLITGDHGAQLAVAYAARYPQSVAHMVLIGPIVRGSDFIPREKRSAMGEVLRRDYGMFTEMVGAMVFGWGEKEGPRYSAFYRQCVDQADAIVIYDGLDATDVTGLLPEVTCPVLVIGRSEGPDPDVCRRVASLLPHGRVEIVEGRRGENVDEATLAVLGDFFGEDWAHDLEAPRRPPGGTLGVILFTDIEDHTRLVDRLGDRRAREVLREYERITRNAIRAHRGTEVKAMGDGFMAWFPSASGAVECAIALQREFADQSDRGDEQVLLRIGLNAGEPVAEEDDLFGTAVIVAARAAAGAAGGEIVATDVVRQLVAGKQYLFSDRGMTALKGFEDPVRTWFLHWERT